MKKRKITNEGKEAINTIIDTKNNDLIKRLFYTYVNQPELLSQIDEKRYQKYQTSLAKRERKNTDQKKRTKESMSGGNNNRIVKVLSTLKNFLEIKEMAGKRISKKGKEYPYPTKKYRLTMKPYFLYLERKGNKLTELQKGFLEVLHFHPVGGKGDNLKNWLNSRYKKKEFNINFLRKEVYEFDGGLFESIDYVIKTLIILPYIKNIFFTRQNLKNPRNDGEKGYDKVVISLIPLLCDELTQESIKSYFRLYLIHLIRARNFGEFSDHIASLLEQLGEKTKAKVNCFFLQCSLSNLDGIVLPLYLEIKNSKTKKIREEIIKNVNIDHIQYGFGEVK